jgi:gag-pre-integrase-like protein
MQSWKVWHKFFGHVSYKSLYELHNRQLCKGFDVNTTSDKPNCPACIQEKQTIHPLKGHHITSAEKGCLTHIDLWGKYDITSIRGNQYFLLLIDDATRYVTLKFLKAKLDAAHEV